MNDPRTPSNSTSRRFTHRGFVFAIGCLVVLRLRSNIHVIKLVPSNGADADEKKIRHIENEKRKFPEGNDFTSLKSHSPIQSNTTTTDIDLVSLTTSDDFFILFNSSAITSWLRFIRNIRSITFIGRQQDFDQFNQNMRTHYPHLLPNYNGSDIVDKTIPPIRWVDETHWMTSYRDKYRCPYSKVCQQLIKVFVFDLRTKLAIDIGNNVLIVDSDTVWGRDVTFVHEDGTVTYFEVIEKYKACNDMDPVKFTEAITMGPLPIQMTGLNHSIGEQKIFIETVTPYRACQRTEYRNASGARHITHHMLFQYDVMMHLHSTIEKAWSTNVWEAFTKCHRNYDFCKSRVSEFELYYSFVSVHYPERLHVVTLVEDVDFVLSSGICSDHEMECCRNKQVLLKGCHNHRVGEANAGGMCCPPEG
jgi:hypothetical protein